MKYKKQNKKTMNDISPKLYAACAAMQGILSSMHYMEHLNIPDEFKKKLVETSFIYAEELLKMDKKIIF